MSRSWRPDACLGTALLAMAGVCQAGRPLTTDDAGVLEASSCEWETYAARVRASGDGGTSRATGWQTQVGCGAGHGAQAAVSLAGSTGGGTHVETAGLGGKFELLAGAEGRPALTATVAVNALRIDGSNFELKDHSAALVLSHSIAVGWTAHANLGVTRDRAARQTSSLWNLALERVLNERVDVMAEVHGDDRGSRWLAGGLRWTPVPAVSLSASVGSSRGLRLATAGIKLAF